MCVLCWWSINLPCHLVSLIVMYPIGTHCSFNRCCWAATCLMVVLISCYCSEVTNWSILSGIVNVYMYDMYPFFPPFRGRQRNAAMWWAVSCLRVKRSPMKNCRSCMSSLASRCFLCLKWATLWPPASPAPPLCPTCWDLTGSTPGLLPTLRYGQYECG